MKRVEIGFRLDPDFKELPGNIGDVIRAAYDRGSISWERRSELIEDYSAAFKVRTYMVPTESGKPMLCGVFLDILPELLG